MKKLLAKIRRARKAIVAAALQVGAVVVMFAPNEAHAVRVGVGLVSALIALLLVYRVPNAPKR